MQMVYHYHGSPHQDAGVWAYCSSFQSWCFNHWEKEILPMRSSHYQKEATKWEGKKKTEHKLIRRCQSYEEK